MSPASKKKTTRKSAAKKSAAKKSAAPSGESPERWQLRLYVAGSTPKSTAAIKNLSEFCERHIPGRYEIEIVDLLKNPQLAGGDQIVAVPTLVRKLPSPIRKMVGDLSNEVRVLVGLNLIQKADQSGAE